MNIDIDKLTETQLINLNRRIVERLKLLESMRAHADMMEFRVGEKVRFRPPGRGPVIGILVKYNRKTVTVLTEDGQSWNVSPHLIEKAKGSATPSNRPGKVIEMKRK